MRVLAISHSCVTAVNQQQFVELNNLADTEVELLIPSNWKNDYSPAPIAPTLLPTVEFPVHRSKVAIAGNVSLHFYPLLPVQHLSNRKFDIILSTQEPWSLSGLQAIVLSRLMRAPLVFQTNQNIYKQYPPPFCWIEQLSYRVAAIGLAYSEEARQVMIRKGFSSPSRVVPYGTDLALFRKQASSELREQLGVQQSIVIGYMGRLVPEKGLVDLVNAVSILIARLPMSNVKLLFVGSGVQERELRELSQAVGIADSVVFAGAVPHDQAGKYMNCIDIFALPSRTRSNWKEQFGRVIIESMACGIPVVGSDSGQIPHLIHDTGGGIVFKEGVSEDLATSLESLVVDAALRDKLGRIGMNAVTERYTYAAVAHALRDALGSALELAGSSAAPAP
ncbi:MAG: glycosyltransferase [Capsulimonadaceae bacterium]|nr:glycosyltransferase [Capsulimonadaceae bacterium]